MLGDLWPSLIVLNLTTAVALALLFGFLMRRPAIDRRVILTFLAFELDMLFWIAGYLGHCSSADPNVSYFWLRLAYGGICEFGLAGLALFLAAAGHIEWLTRRRVLLLALPGVLLYVGLLTNDWHRLFFSSVTTSGGFGGLHATGGVLFWVLWLLTYAYQLAGLAIYLQPSAAKGASRWWRVLALAATIPIIAVSILLGLELITLPFQLTPLLISLVSLVYILSLSRYWRSDVVQVALSQAIEQMGDGIVVVDLQHRVLYANSAFAQIAEKPLSALVGQSVVRVANNLQQKMVSVSPFQPLMQQVLDNPWQRVTADVVILRPERRTYEMAIWPIRGSQDQLVGRVATMRDVTEARTTNQHLERAVADVEALHDTAVAITSRHDIGDILGLILGDLRQLTAADQVRVAITDQEGNTLSVHAHIDERGVLELAPVSKRPSPLTADILRGGQPRFVENVDVEKALRSGTMPPSTQAYAGVPLIIHDRKVGLLYVTYNQPHSFADTERWLIQSLASHAAVAIANAQMFDEIKRAAITDALTDLPNHRHLMDRMDAELARARRSGHPLAVMMIDIDDFKLVNDAHGHTVGDRLLHSIAKTIRDALRETDVVGRYGGDEFLALLPETDRFGAYEVAQRVVAAVHAERFCIPGREDQGVAARGAAGHFHHDAEHVERAIPLHLSIGVAIFPYDSSTRLDLINLADAALYAAKRDGGDQATLAQATDSGFLAGQGSTFSVLEGLVHAVDRKDHYTRVHSQQVARYSLALAEALGLTSETKRMIRVASLLHDVGKIGIPDHILRKPGPLNEEERRVIEQHPLLSEMIMREAPQLTEVLEAVRHHHERYDGSGYPRGLRDGEIPLLSRMIAIADAYSAMILDRPYRKAISAEQAVAELRRCAGTQFDPELVEYFIRSLPLTQEKGQADPPALAS